MERSSFFSAIISPEGIPDRVYKDDDYARYFNSFIANGVFPNPSTNLQSISNNDMTINVQRGKGWINGYFYENTDFLKVTLDPADGVLNRIDRIVLRLDALGREIRISVKKGEFASSPVAKTLQRDVNAYELALADVYIGKGVISIGQASVTDRRLDSTVCGLVHGVVDQVDVTTLYNQYSALFDGKRAEFEQQFNTWFSGLESVLDSNTAANLLNMINDLQTQVSQHLADYVQTKNSYNDHKIDDVLHNISVKVIKSNKDAEGIFTTVEQRRKTDNTLVRKSVLSGGTTPLYTTRTITYYGTNGSTVLKTDVFTLTYDADGVLISEV